MRKKILTDEQLAEIKRRYVAGETRHVLAKEFYVSESCISKHLIGLKKRDYYVLSDTQREAVRKLYLQGVKIKVIAECYYVSAMTISRTVKCVKNRRISDGI